MSERRLGMSEVPRRAAWTLAVGLCWLIVAAPAQAKLDRVTGGQQTVSPSSAIANLVAFLRAHGITVTAIPPAKSVHGSLTMPIIGGSMTVPNMQGVMECKGGLQFKERTRVLRVRDYRLSHQNGSATLSALVSGKRVSLRRIALAHMLVTKTNTSGKNGTMTGGLKITATWAHLIDQLLGKQVLKAGADLGDLSASVHFA
jgi:hypothetical protein